MEDPLPMLKLDIEIGAITMSKIFRLFGVQVCKQAVEYLEYGSESKARPKRAQFYYFTPESLKPLSQKS